MWICWKRNGVRIKPEYGHQFNCHGLTHAAPAPPPPPPPKEYTSSYNPKYRVRNPELVNASTAPLMTFHLYRVQSDANYSCCANADLTTAGAAMFYLHNEIVWHAKSRAGTNFADPKTRIRRYKVWTLATQPLYDLGMNFGVDGLVSLLQRVGYATLHVRHKCDPRDRKSTRERLAELAFSSRGVVNLAPRKTVCSAHPDRKQVEWQNLSSPKSAEWEPRRCREWQVTNPRSVGLDIRTPRCT